MPKKPKAVRQYPSQTQTFGSVAAFLNIISGLRPLWRKLNLPTQTESIRPYGEERVLWFRGQSDTSWGLAPRVWRKEYADANEAEIRLEFESVGTPLIQSLNTPDKWHWYFLMQHYRAPTRLLDWTTNPLVALYFAVCENDGVDGAVWVVDPWRWNRAHVKYLYGPALAGWQETTPYLLDLEEAFDTDRDENQTRKKWPIAIEPHHIDRRIAAQGSKFILFGTQKDMTLSPAVNRPRDKDGKHAILDKIIVTKKDKESLRVQLNEIGISERAMFPDLEGLGRHLAWVWKSRKIPAGKKKALKRLRFERIVDDEPRA